jgi:hypothetical protein
MKKFILISVLSAVIFSCKKNSNTELRVLPTTLCQEESTMDLAIIDCYDKNPLSLHFNQVVAKVSIKKETIKRSGKCLEEALSECRNYISIRNLTSKRISFPYSLDFKSKSSTWHYESTAAIARAGSSGEEAINADCGNLHSADISIATGTIYYK